MPRKREGNAEAMAELQAQLTPFLECNESGRRNNWEDVDKYKIHYQGLRGEAFHCIISFCLLNSIEIDHSLKIGKVLVRATSRNTLQIKVYLHYADIYFFHTTTALLFRVIFSCLYFLLLNAWERCFTMSYVIITVFLSNTLTARLSFMTKYFFNSGF